MLYVYMYIPYMPWGGGVVKELNRDLKIVDLNNFNSTYLFVMITIFLSRVCYAFGGGRVLGGNRRMTNPKQEFLVPICFIICISNCCFALCVDS
jgi:hypothetical protein